MNWNNITLKQYQDLYPVLMDDTLTDLDKAVRVLSIILNVTEDEIDSWPLEKLKDYKDSISFLINEDIPRKVPKYIHTNGKRYRFVHEIQKMPAARYIEAKTYRHGGHHVNDPGSYMPKEKLEYYKSKDPLTISRKYLLEKGEGKEEEIKRIEADVDDEIEKAIDFAKSSEELSKEKFVQMVEAY